MRQLSHDRAALLCGVIFIGFGIFFSLQSLKLEIGTALGMGPGYFPLLLALMLIGLGLAIAVRALSTAGELLGAVAWRGMFFILFAPIIFGLTVNGAGFVPALALAGLTAALASRRMRLGTALVLVAGLTLFCVVGFSYGLGLPFQLFGPWLSL